MRIILDNIRSISNVGSVFRTADALGIEKIYLGGITPGPLDFFGRPIRKFVKVSLGAEKTVSWEKAKNVSRLADKLRKEGFRLIAVEQSEDSVPYFKLKIKKSSLKKTAFIFGNEVGGISKSVMDKCDKIIEIPMLGRKESLNVAVSFGVAMFHVLYN